MHSKAVAIWTLIEDCPAEEIRQIISDLSRRADTVETLTVGREKISEPPLKKTDNIPAIKTTKVTPDMVLEIVRGAVEGGFRG